MGKRRKNMYRNLNEFIREYDDNDYGEFVEKHIGIEFEYRGKFYRMCNEPVACGLPIKDGVVLNICTYTGPDETYCCQKELGWYKDLNDCLDRWIIDGTKFRDVMSDPNTRVIAQD